eukprot:jgi/Mesen1/8447/ME000475S07699
MSLQSSQINAEHSEAFDLETYISNYNGHTKIARLRFIAERCQSKATELEALKMAIEEIKRGENTAVYRETMERVLGKSPGQKFDVEWVETVERRATQRQEKLDVELNGYKTNLIKESIRMGYNDLGDFHYARGDLQAAFKCYVRTRDYCTTSKHIIAMCLNVILVSIELGHFVHVTNYVQKAEQTPDVQDPVILAKFKCASGLANLENKKYKLAARKFVETNFELGSNYSEVVAPQDIALYGGLCALASFDRLELKKLKEILALDIHLYDHVDSLYEQIRHRALIQYTTPFISVDLRTMAEAFNTSARIDSHNKILFARHADQRNVTFQRALQTGADYLQDTQAMILRANLMRNDFYGKSVRGKQAL